jgi:hydrogenase maturation protein HypF
MTPPPDNVARLRAVVRGVVQGVGFRPFVYRLAREHALSGYVRNDERGAVLEVEGAGTQAFLTELRTKAPPLSRIDSVELTELPPERTGTAFEIIESSRTGRVTAPVTADAAVCDDCLGELFDPNDRRYRYPFLNCTNCGPRYTITRSLPYDRPQTALSGFPLCPACEHEYRDPLDRRFHAQPVACPRCGPQLSASIEAMTRVLLRGEIVALKGLGGYLLAVDARQAASVERLRVRKQRDAKPFAVMVANLESARAIAFVNDEEAALLKSPRRPIVLLRARPEAKLAPALAPGLDTVGVMLPPTPLQMLLFHEAAGRPEGTAWLQHPVDLVLVMTSANLGGEPIITVDLEAQRQLASIADLIVTHDRPVVARADDSVTRVVDGVPLLIRRSRGFVPEGIKLARALPSVIALGAHQKTTVCVTRGAEAFLSPHVGDLDDAETLRFHRETLAHLLDVLEVEPVAVAHDLHPDFHSTTRALDFGLPTVAVQHHHAHVMGVLAEHGRAGPQLGLALDGFGLGTDGGAWGGELLLVDGPRFERLGHFRQLGLPGGDEASRQPWRMATAALHAMGLGEVARARFSDVGPVDGVLQLLDRGLRTPMTSSAGRWFDAACGLLGVQLVSSYEGEAPMRLERLVRTPRVLREGWAVKDGVLDLLPLLLALTTTELQLGAELFHGTLAAALVDWAVPELEARGLREIAVSGGCFLNAVLLSEVTRRFGVLGVKVLRPLQHPANDGGLALGQAVVAALHRLEVT